MSLGVCVSRRVVHLKNGKSVFVGLVNLIIYIYRYGIANKGDKLCLLVFKFHEYYSDLRISSYSSLNLPIVYEGRTLYYRGGITL